MSVKGGYRGNSKGKYEGSAREKFEGKSTGQSREMNIEVNGCVYISRV